MWPTANGGNRTSSSVYGYLLVLALVMLLFNFYFTSRTDTPSTLDNMRISTTIENNVAIIANSDSTLLSGKLTTLDTFYSPVNPDNVRKLLDTYRAEVLYSANSNLFRVNDKIFTADFVADSKRTKFRMKEFDSCQASTLLDLFNILHNPIVDMKKLYPNFVPEEKQELSIEAPVLDRSYMETESQILIIYTTCNQLPMTILSLQFLRNTDKLADLLIVDDHSTDGTVEYLQKRGFAVITKPKATGLTDSWNIGYRVAVALGYKNVIFTNNDVLLTTGSVALMYQGLREYGLVVPLTTDKGAGHHPAQSIMRAYRLPAAMLSYTDDYRNAEGIQESILKKYIFVPPEQRRCPAELSKAKGLPKFNGFCFSVNVEKITPAAFETNVHLFDPADLIVGQEDHLVQRMHQHGLMPIILHCAFVYHFKSVTVSSANFTEFKQKLQAYNVTARQVGKSPITKLFYKVSENETITKTFDIREDLRWYHPEEQQDFIADIFNWTVAKAVVIEPDIRDQLKCKANIKEGVLFPKYSAPVMSRLERLYAGFSRMNWNIRANPVCVYPSQWPPHCQNMLTGGSSFEPELYAVTSSHYIVVAIAMSDPAKNPSAGDVFTAYELGNALMALYSHVKVKYLRRGAQWYAPELLSDVDVLITLLDQYELTRSLSLFQDPTPPSFPKNNQFQCTKKLQVKPNMISIAWVRNWFHRWAAKPWIGNYDLIFTSSSLSKAFFDELNEHIGLPVSCALSCPHKVQGYKMKKLLPKFLSEHAKDPKGLVQDSEDWRYFSTRSKTPVYVYPIATAIEYDSVKRLAQRGSQGKNKVAIPSLRGYPRYNSSNPWIAETRRLFGGVDYVFTGSYFNVPRRIMSFDPDDIPQWHGRIVGGNWPKVKQNVSAGWMKMCMGLLPYDMVKESYKYVKIVVDDANHVTDPWGSVNSRVFDALASGAMIVSNGRVGMEELFGEALKKEGLALPLFESGKDLASQLQFYLSNDKVREKTAQVMRDTVLSKHTYRSRAVQLVELLENRFSMKFTKRPPEAIVADTPGNAVRKVKMLARQKEALLAPKRRLEEEVEEVGEEAEVSAVPSFYSLAKQEEEGRRRLIEEVSIVQHEDAKDSLFAPETVSEDQNEAMEVTPEVLAGFDMQVDEDLMDESKEEEEEEEEEEAPRRQLSEKKSVPSKAKTAMPTRPRFRRNRHSADNLPDDIHSLCVGIRTAHLQSEWLPVLIRSMIVQHQKSAYRKSLALQLFVVDTEANTEYTQFLIELADKYNDRYQFPYVQVMIGVQTAVDNTKPIGVYGYDDTDRLLNLMLSMKQCFPRGNNAEPTHGNAGQSNSSRFQHSAAFLIPSCEWMMFTNGDNMYNSAWFDTIAPLAIAQTPIVDAKNPNVTRYEDGYDIVGWDFITHHPRGPKNDTPNQPITIALERKFLDLGSVIVRSSLFTRSNTKFLQEAALTKDLFARDYFTIKRILPLTKPEKVKLIHQYLLMHQ